MASVASGLELAFRALSTAPPLSQSQRPRSSNLDLTVGDLPASMAKKITKSKQPWTFAEDPREKRGLMSSDRKRVRLRLSLGCFTVDVCNFPP